MAKPREGFKCPTTEEWEEGAVLRLPVETPLEPLSDDITEEETRDPQWYGIDVEQSEDAGWPEPADEPECFDLPIRIWTACQKYMYNEVMDCFFEYFQREFGGENLESEKWKRMAESDYVRQPDGRIAYIPARPWNNRHAIEMDDWVRLYENLCHRKTEHDHWDYKILSACKQFRHDAVHRHEASVERIFFVLKLPELLRDRERAHNFLRLVPVLCHNETIEGEEKRRMNELLHSDPIAPDTGYGLLARIQDILEESCFYNAIRRGKCATTGEDRTCPEYFELQNWETQWQHLDYRDETHEELAALDESSGIDGKIENLKQLRIIALRTARDLRNKVAHRSPVEDWEIPYYTATAMLYAMLLGDRSRALKIEILAETFASKSTCNEVVTRLLKDSGDDYSSRRRAILALTGAKNLRASSSASSTSKAGNLVGTEILSSVVEANQTLLKVRKRTVIFSEKSRSSYPKLNLLLKYIFSNNIITSAMITEPYKGSLFRSNLAIQIFIFDKSTHPILKTYRFPEKTWLSQGTR